MGLVSVVIISLAHLRCVMGRLWYTKIQNNRIQRHANHKFNTENVSTLSSLEGSLNPVILYFDVSQYFEPPDAAPKEGQPIYIKQQTIHKHLQQDEHQYKTNEQGTQKTLRGNQKTEKSQNVFP